MAYTPSSPVRQNSSTTTKPRSSTFTPVPSRPSRSANGRRPTDTTTASTSTCSSSPKWTVVPPASFGVWPVTFTPVRMSIFFFLKLRTTTLVTSLSSPGSSLGNASRIVTWEPRSANVDANSQPMAPPPMTTMRGGM